MKNLPANPLAAIVKKAAALPAVTGRVAAQQARIDRRNGCVVIVADVSYSMADTAFGGHQRKIDVLRDAVDSVRTSIEARLIAFSRRAEFVATLPEPVGNTDLAAALKLALTCDPGRILVISDGIPDSESAALLVARQARGAIDVLYVGPESNIDAIEFMQRLAKSADGVFQLNDISSRSGASRLRSIMGGMLPPPTED